MATEMDLFDNVGEFRTKFNTLVSEFNAVSSITEIATDIGTLTVSPGQLNIPIGIVGTGIISTYVAGSNVTVGLANGPITIGNTTTFTGTITMSGAGVNITNLNVGSGAGAYSFPTSAGTLGQALVVDGSGNLTFGAGGTGYSSIFQFPDTPSNSGTGASVLFLNNTSGADPTAVSVSAGFYYQNSRLNVPSITYTNTFETGTPHQPFSTTTIDYSFDALRIFKQGSSTNEFHESMATLISTVSKNENSFQYTGMRILMGCDADSLIGMQIRSDVVNAADRTARNNYNIFLQGNLDNQVSTYTGVNAAHTMWARSGEPSPNITNHYSFLEGQLTLVTTSTGSVCDTAYGLKYSVNAGYTLAGNVLRHIYGAEFIFSYYDLNNTQTETIRGLSLRSSLGVVTNTTARDNSYAIYSDLPFQSSFSGPIHLAMDLYGNSEPVFNIKSTDAGTPSGSPPEAIKIVFNNNVRYIPLYTSVV